MDDYPRNDEGELFRCRVKSCRAPARPYVIRSSGTGLDVLRYFCDEHQEIMSLG